MEKNDYMTTCHKWYEIVPAWGTLFWAIQQPFIFLWSTINNPVIHRPYFFRYPLLIVRWSTCHKKQPMSSTKQGDPLTPTTPGTNCTNCCNVRITIYQVLLPAVTYHCCNLPGFVCIRLNYSVVVLAALRYTYGTCIWYVPVNILAPYPWYHAVSKTIWISKYLNCGVLNYELTLN